MNASSIELNDEFDKELTHLILEIENNSKSFSKKELLIIDAWCKKFCEVTSNIEWKKNRNLHAIYLLDMIMNKRIEEPYNRFPKEETIPTLNKALVKSKLSNKIREIDFSNHVVEFKPHNEKESDRDINQKDVGFENLNFQPIVVKNKKEFDSKKQVLNPSSRKYLINYPNYGNSNTSRPKSGVMRKKSESSIKPMTSYISKKIYKSKPMHMKQTKDSIKQKALLNNIISELTLRSSKISNQIEIQDFEINELNQKLHTLKRSLEALVLNQNSNYNI
jgi:hypothetical protein